MSTRSVCCISALMLLGLTCPAAAGDPAKGNILFESWQFDTGGWGGLDELKDSWDYPDKPHESFWQQIFERPDEGNEYFGERARGYLYPPETGDYTFWIASDDNSELYLSTDENPAHAVLVANVTSWTGWRQWNAFASQQSPAIRLTAGERYYIEALLCQGGGAGFLSVGWLGPGVAPGPSGRFDPAVIDGRYLAPFFRSPEPLLMAQSPAPADGAAAVNSRLLTWGAGPTAQQHDVYFGTSPNPPFIRRQTDTTYTTPILTGGTKYYWRIDEVEADGQTIHAGPAWTFTAVTAYPTDPHPANGARNVFPSGSVSWLAGRGSASHHLYFGLDRAAVSARTADADKGLLTDASFNAGVLRSATMYYWLVDEIQSDGAVRKGPVWSFATESAMPCAVLREWWTQIPGDTVDRLTGDPRFPDQPTGCEFLDAFEGPVNFADYYGSRLRGWLAPVVSGAYRFWIAGDDSSELWLSPDADPARATRIAAVSGSTGEREWAAQSGQKSAAVTLTAGRKYYIEALMKEEAGGDHIAVAWQPPGGIQEVIPGTFMDTFALMPLQAWIPDPPDGATEVSRSPALSWSAGETGAQHRVYFGDNKAAVESAGVSTSGIYKGVSSGTTFQPGSLAWGKTYFWRIDELPGAGSPSLWKGHVWSFTTADFLSVEDFDAYRTGENPGSAGYVWDTWKSAGGATVNWIRSDTVHVGGQSVLFQYDNAILPYSSEATRAWSSSQNWKINGVDTLSLWFKAESIRPIENPAGTMTFSASGKDIGGTSDEFRFVYKRLGGDGTIVVRVEQFYEGANIWARGGPMIRESLDPDARFVAALIRPFGVIDVQCRSTKSGTCQSSPTWGVSVPRWLKLSRSGDTITAQYSQDGMTWRDLSGAASVTLPMTGSLYMGLALSNCNPWGPATARFSDIRMTGGVPGSWAMKDVGVNHPGNRSGPFYVTLRDAAGKTATVNHPGDPLALLKMDWTQWKIPLSQFTGINAGAIREITVGTGNGKSSTGDGALFLDDIRVIRSTSP